MGRRRTQKKETEDSLIYQIAEKKINIWKKPSWNWFETTIIVMIVLFVTFLSMLKSMYLHYLPECGLLITIRLAKSLILGEFGTLSPLFSWVTLSSFKSQNFDMSAFCKVEDLYFIYLNTGCGATVVQSQGTKWTFYLYKGHDKLNFYF